MGSVMFELEVDHSGTLGRVESTCPELTSFFAHWWIDDDEQLDS